MPEDNNPDGLFLDKSQDPRVLPLFLRHEEDELFIQFRKKVKRTNTEKRKHSRVDTDPL